VAQILVRDVEDSVKRELQRRASQHGRSLQAEVPDILREAAKSAPPAYGLGTEIVRIVQASGLEFPEFKELRGWKAQIPDFSEPARKRRRHR
jgi:plasmid stability protein